MVSAAAFEVANTVFMFIAEIRAIRQILSFMFINFMVKLRATFINVVVALVMPPMLSLGVYWSNKFVQLMPVNSGPRPPFAAITDKGVRRS